MKMRMIAMVLVLTVLLSGNIGCGSTVSTSLRPEVVVSHGNTPSETPTSTKEKRAEGNGQGWHITLKVTRPDHSGIDTATSDSHKPLSRVIVEILIQIGAELLRDYLRQEVFGK